jgi:hypothetical protein
MTSLAAQAIAVSAVPRNISSLLATARKQTGTRGKPRRDHPETSHPKIWLQRLAPYMLSVAGVEVVNFVQTRLTIMQYLVPGQEAQQGYCH